MSRTSLQTREAPTVPRWINHFVIWLLLSPFHPLLSHTTMLLTFTGRQSGYRYTILVRYLRDGDTLLTATDSRWWLNLRGGARVLLRLAGCEVAGTAEVHTDPEQLEQGIRAILRRMPRDVRFYQVLLDRSGQPDQMSMKQAAQVHVLITILMANHRGEQEAVACSNNTTIYPSHSRLFFRRK